MAYTPASLRPGDVLLKRATWNDPVGLLIGCAQGSPYCHAAWVGDGFLVEALELVTVSPLGKYAAVADAYTLTVQPTDEQLTAMEQYAKKQVGRPYGWKDVAADFARFVLHIPVPRPILVHRMDCSMLVWAITRAGGINLSNAPYVAPLDLAYSPLLAPAP
jgi:uncharacterized protein YycO